MADDAAEKYEIEDYVRKQLPRATFTFEGALGADTDGKVVDVEQFFDWLRAHRLKLGWDK